MIIPFFLMNRGCPHCCLFCNERLTAGDRPEQITAEAFAQTIDACLAGGMRRKGPAEIAFYGGTFTAMDLAEQRRLLGLAAPYLADGRVSAIRISTRPDEIDAGRLDLLADHGVATVELGAQSLDDGVLAASRRGHRAADTVRSLGLLKERGFKTGLHLMAGLPGDSPERFAKTVERTIALGPDTVRIHPTLVLRDTALAQAFRRGDYLPLGLFEAVELAKQALRAFAAAGISVIRLGIQTTRELEEPGAVIAGPFHPAFRSLVETSLFLEMAAALLSSAGRDDMALRVSGAASGPATVRFVLSPADVSNFRGRGQENLASLKRRFGLGEICIATDPGLPRGTLVLTNGKSEWRTGPAGRIDLRQFSR
jgi:histone acetyltransferase (RNA polymerase elongator complex component)